MLFYSCDVTGTFIHLRCIVERTTRILYHVRAVHGQIANDLSMHERSATWSPCFQTAARGFELRPRL